MKTKFNLTTFLTLFGIFISRGPLLADLAGSNSDPKTKRGNSYAVWYRVPPNSLAHRRAQGCEFTAAHNHLPIGTLVRVTRLSNGKSVLVRITDRGITNRRANIDICKEAAEELGMVREGFSRVMLEIIPELPAATTTNQDQVAEH